MGGAVRRHALMTMHHYRRLFGAFALSATCNITLSATCNIRYTALFVIFGTDLSERGAEDGSKSALNQIVILLSATCNIN
eukprot:5844525-Pleurochrysis_carterae.AAC.1